jgi:hypothetical protein
LAGHCGALPAAAGGSRRPPSRHPDYHRHHPRGRTARPVQQRAARRGRTGMAPTPAAYPSPAGRATLAGRLRPLGLDPPATAPGRLPGPAAAPAVNGPLAQRRQRPRRRITPNTKTSTTTMISTHNHVDMAASLVGAGQFKLTLLPPTRASNSVTARRPPRGPDRRQRYARARGDPGTPRPAADLGWPVGPGGGEPFRATPSQPSPTGSTSTTRVEDPAGVNRPNATTATRPAGEGEAEQRLPCLGGGTIQAWLCRCAMADAAPPAPDRWCAPSAKPELVPRTAAPPGCLGTTPLGAARSTKAGTSRR